MQEVSELENERTEVAESRLRESFDEFECTFRRRYPVIWLATLVGPFAVTVLLLAGVYLASGGAYTWKLIVTAVTTFFVFGRFVILAGHGGEMEEIHQFLSAGQLFAMVTYMDLCVAMLVTFHIGLFFKVPVVGPRIAALVADGQFILRNHPWMRRAAFVGLVAFVMIPIAATGSIGGSIFGRLLGMSRGLAFLGIAAGSLLGNGLMYYFSDLISKYVDKSNPVVQFGGIAVIVLLVIFLERRHRMLKQQFLDSQRSQPAPEKVESKT